MKQNINFFSSSEEFFSKVYKFKDQDIILIEDEKKVNMSDAFSMFLKVNKNIEDIFLEKIRAIFIVGEEDLLCEYSHMLTMTKQPIFFVPTKLSSLLNFIEENKNEAINVIAYLELFNFSAIEVSKIFSIITAKISVMENLMFENLFFKKKLPSLFDKFISIVYKLLNGFKEDNKINKKDFFKIVEDYVMFSQKINLGSKSIAKKASELYSKMVNTDSYKEENELVFAYLISKLLKNFLDNAPFCEVERVDFYERYNFSNTTGKESERNLNFTTIAENKLSIYKMKEIRTKLARFYDFSHLLLLKSFEIMKQIKEDNGFNYIGTIDSEAMKTAISFSPDYSNFNALTIMRNLGYLN